MLSIVIVNYKNAPLLRLCLKSLCQIIPNEFNHEIIVVDDSAGSETAHVATKEFSQVVYLPFKENVGYTRGVNQGLKKSKGDFVLVLNPDVVPLEGSLQKMYEYMKNHPEVALLGPKLLNFDGSFQQSCFRFYTPLTIIYRRTFLRKLPFIKNILDRFLMKDKDLGRPLKVDWLMGSALMVSQEAVRKSGFMDERFYLYMSDVDWPRQFWENGYQVVFFPEAVMYHYHLRESHGRFGALDAIFNKRTQQHIADAIRYFWKNGINKVSYI